MKIRVVSWNVRGVNDGEKRKIIKALLRMQKAYLVCLQETKVKGMSCDFVRSLGTGRFLDWEAVSATGAFGGILIFWDRRMLQLIDKEEG